MKEKSVILYAKGEIAGITFRPDSRVIMEKAVQGHPIEVTSGNDYINLYHVFERMQQANKKLAGLKLTRKQFGESRWRLFVGDEAADTPSVELLEGYDPKRGRYKRYAEQLAANEVLTLASRPEAVKARRAWQLYVPKEKRRHLRSSIANAGRGKFTVTIRER